MALPYMEVFKMISSVVLVGYLGENTGEGFRNIRTKHFSLKEEKDVWYTIPCLYWSRDDKSYLNNLNVKTPVVIRGRIEASEERGLYILVETVEVV